jgi:hypothetical protein
MVDKVVVEEVLPLVVDLVLEELVDLLMVEMVLVEPLTLVVMVEQTLVEVVVETVSRSINLGHLILVLVLEVLVSSSLLTQSDKYLKNSYEYSER